MIDLRELRDSDEYCRGAVRKGADPGEIEHLLTLDAERRALRQEVEELRASANAASKEIGRADPSERDAKIAAASELKARVSEVEARHTAARDATHELALTMPNPAHESVPDGGEDDYEVLDEVGERTPPPPMDHAEYGEHMGWTDSARGARTSGSRFTYLRGEAVLLELALVQFTFRKLVAKGFEPVVPPVLVNEAMMVDAGFFPTDRNQVYEVGEDGLFLVGTSEVPLAGLHRGERLEPDELPLRYAGFSSCFRREAGTYGKDTRGIFRVHQFDKVEMFVFSPAERSWDELELLLAVEREILDELELPYRVIAVAAGDLGAAAAKKYDCEVWLPSEGRHREVTSCSNYLDYSARRLETRVRTADGSQLVHTLNGTACAISRWLVFLFEHCQAPDGSFVVPEALRPWTGFDRVDAR